MSKLATKFEKTRDKVLMLLGQTDPPLSQQKVAELAGCSSKTVWRILQRIAPQREEVEQRLEQYQTLLRKHLPIAYRARRLRTIADNGQQLMPALKAIERADILDGFTRPEREPATSSQPLFSLPRDCNVAIGVWPAGGEQARDLNHGERPQLNHAIADVVPPRSVQPESPAGCKNCCHSRREHNALEPSFCLWESPGFAHCQCQQFIPPAPTAPSVLQVDY